ncbi:hypothetical protein GCM10010191_90660 [Actinomadura vinacea]|uniref:DUF1192 domain-containing protein n=1 Tax=Actinomadura vinacea TaxID=115336 RepID=A0ABN3KDU7_9ACTN
MTGRRRTSGVEGVVSFGPRGTRARRTVTLTDEERQAVLTELAEITAELDELLSRAEEIGRRVAGAETPARSTWHGAA